jgi:SAM-dependent methyltransferase
MSSTSDKVGFDQYADEYVKLLDAQKRMFGGERSYFSEYKIKLLREMFPNRVGSILDFGSGVGLSIPYIKQYFPEAQITATDISSGSLAHLAARFPDIDVTPDADVDFRRFDVILVITVLHHVAPKLRPALMERLVKMLGSGGRLCIFEHNPYNPLTRRMVSTCPFDSDAILLDRAESRSLITQSAKLRVSRTGYTLFVPHALRSLRFIEPALSWLPLGGQYYVVGER